MRKSLAHVYWQIKRQCRALLAALLLRRSGANMMEDGFTSEKCLRMLCKKWHVIYFGQCHWLWGKNARKMLLRWMERWQLFLAVTALQFLATVRDRKFYFGRSFDGSVISREYSFLQLAKNRSGVVWFSVIDVEIAGLHVEDIRKRWVMFTLSVYCMFRATP